MTANNNCGNIVEVASDTVNEDADFDSGAEFISDTSFSNVSFQQEGAISHIFTNNIQSDRQPGQIFKISKSEMSTSKEDYSAVIPSSPNFQFVMDNSSGSLLDTSTASSSSFGDSEDAPRKPEPISAVVGATEGSNNVQHNLSNFQPATNQSISNLSNFQPPTNQSIGSLSSFQPSSNQSIGKITHLPPGSKIIKTSTGQFIIKQPVNKNININRLLQQKNVSSSFIF